MTPSRRANEGTTQPAGKILRLTRCFSIGTALLLVSSLLPAQSPTQPPTAQVPTEQEAIRGIDAAVRVRAASVASYTVQELYSIYRNGEAAPSAQVTVKTVYTRGVGKEYTPLSQTGSALLRSVVIDRILTTEKEMAKAENRDLVAITSANYEMHMQPGEVSLNDHECIVITLKARRKSPHLFNGKGWFDASDFTLVHLEGAPAQNVSIFAGETSGRRDYAKVDGFSMATHAEMHSHSFLFGDTLMKIDYTNYDVQLSPSEPPGSHASP